jgi:hypothetical protein
MNELLRDLRDAVVRLPEPTLGLRGNVNRGKVIDLINAVMQAASPDALDVERLRKAIDAVILAGTGQTYGIGYAELIATEYAALAAKLREAGEG